MMRTRNATNFFSARRRTICKRDIVMSVNLSLLQRVKNIPLFMFTFLAVSLLYIPSAVADAVSSTPPPIKTETVTVHGTSLVGNLEGDSVDRGVTIYLPPSYNLDPTRRYPVVYALHGYSINNRIWAGEIKTPQTIAAAFAGQTREMIVVLADAQTLHNGSMYSNSQTTGNWEGFIAHDLVSYVDSHYRTLADRRSRGLVGHSMGGYGATRIGMKYPDVFSSLYVMSPCCLSARTQPPAEVEQKLEAFVESARDTEEAVKLDWISRATLAVAAAWSPNPMAPPFYLDLPTKNGIVRPDVLAKWAANAPLSMVDQYINNLRRYNAIAIDVGDQDGLNVDSREFHRILSSYGIANDFEIYRGTHTSAVADRFQKHVLPFFGRTLSFSPSNVGTE